MVIKRENMDITGDYSSIYTLSTIEKKAICETCSKEYRYDAQKIGFSTLRNHYMTKHPGIFKIFERKRKPDAANDQPSVSNFSFNAMKQL